jgi:DNA-binding transcriptional regulator YhcF (GntR family)
MLWNLDSRSSSPLHEQIAANVRRAIADGVLEPGERLPPAGELAALLQVNANTALAAYRRLRTEGILEFRRGRGVRVRADSQALSSVTIVVRELLELGRKQGYTASELAQLVAAFGAKQS